MKYLVYELYQYSSCQDLSPPFSYLRSVLSELVEKGLGDSDLNKEQGLLGRQCRTGQRALAPHCWKQPLLRDGRPGLFWLPRRQRHHQSLDYHHQWYLKLSTNMQPSSFHKESHSKQYIILLSCLNSELWSLHSSFALLMYFWPKPNLFHYWHTFHFQWKSIKVLDSYRRWTTTILGPGKRGNTRTYFYWVRLLRF